MLLTKSTECPSHGVLPPPTPPNLPLPPDPLLRAEQTPNSPGLGPPTDPRRPPLLLAQPTPLPLRPRPRQALLPALHRPAKGYRR